MSTDDRNLPGKGREKLVISGQADPHDLEGTRLEEAALYLGLTQEEVQRMATEIQPQSGGVLETIHQRLMLLLDHASTRSTHPLQALEDIFHAHLRFLLGNPLIPWLLKYMMTNRRSSLGKQVNKVMRDYQFDIYLILQSARSQGMLHSGVDTKAAALLFVSMLQGMVLRLQVIRDDDAVRADAQYMIRGYLDALRIEAVEGL